MFYILPVTARNYISVDQRQWSPAFPPVPDRQPLECPPSYGL